MKWYWWTLIYAVLVCLWILSVMAAAKLAAANGTPKDGDQDSTDTEIMRRDHD